MSHASHDSANEYEEVRDFDAEFEIFLLEHQLHISLEEVYHLAPLGQSTEEIRQHNHVVVRSSRTNRALTLCATAMNWEGHSIAPNLVLANLAAEVRVLNECEGDFPSWAATFEFDADSRAVERRFNQTAAIAEMLQSLLGEAAYTQLIQLSEEAAQDSIESDDNF